MGQLVNTGRELTAATIQNAHEDDEVATSRAKVASSYEPEGHEIMRIPCNPQCPGFEEQLKEIDDAIFGEVLEKGGGREGSIEGDKPPGRYKHQL
nr:hypothetical protein CFP56_26952 [Quercus suber]